MANRRAELRLTMTKHERVLDSLLSEAVSSMVMYGYYALDESQIKQRYQELLSEETDSI